MKKDIELQVKSRHIKGNLWEVEGCIFDADSMAEAVRKWVRRQNPKKIESKEK